MDITPGDLKSSNLPEALGIGGERSAELMFKMLELSTKDKSNRTLAEDLIDLGKLANTNEELVLITYSYTKLLTVMGAID